MSKFSFCDHIRLSSFPIFHNFLPNPGRTLPVLTYNGCDPLYKAFLFVYPAQALSRKAGKGYKKPVMHIV